MRWNRRRRLFGRPHLRIGTLSAPRPLMDGQVDTPGVGQQTEFSRISRGGDEFAVRWRRLPAMCSGRRVRDPCRHDVPAPSHECRRPERGVLAAAPALLSDGVSAARSRRTAPGADVPTRSSPSPAPYCAPCRTTPAGRHLDSSCAGSALGPLGLRVVHRRQADSHGMPLARHLDLLVAGLVPRPGQPGLGSRDVAEGGPRSLRPTPRSSAPAACPSRPLIGRERGHGLAAHGALDLVDRPRRVVLAHVAAEVAGVPTSPRALSPHAAMVGGARVARLPQRGAACGRATTLRRRLRDRCRS